MKKNEHDDVDWGYPHDEPETAIFLVGMFQPKLHGFSFCGFSHGFFAIPSGSTMFHLLLAVSTRPEVVSCERQRHLQPHPPMVDQSPGWRKNAESLSPRWRGVTLSSLCLAMWGCHFFYGNITKYREDPNVHIVIIFVGIFILEANKKWEKIPRYVPGMGYIISNMLWV